MIGGGLEGDGEVVRRFDVVWLFLESCGALFGFMCLFGFVLGWICALWGFEFLVFVAAGDGDVDAGNGGAADDDDGGGLHEE